MYNHLLSKVFRFHYHSQKVIGSLGIGYIWRFRFYKSVSDQQGSVIGVMGTISSYPKPLRICVFFFDSRNGWKWWLSTGFLEKHVKPLSLPSDVLATCVSIAHLMSLTSFKCGGSNGNMIHNVLFGKLTSRRKIHLLQDSSR